MSGSDIFLGLIAVLFPPIAVWIKSGLCSSDSLINILLCMLGYVPGLLHAWYIIAKYPEGSEYDYEPVVDAEAGRGGNNNVRGQRVTYYYVSHEQPAQNQRGYGTQGPPVPAGSRPKPHGQQGQQSGVVGVGGVESSSRQPAGPAQGAGSNEEGAPPSYSDVVKGDNKVQTP